MKVSQLRVLQIICLAVAAAACLMVARLGNPRGSGEAGTIQWVIALVALYTAVSSFTVQRKLTNGPIRPHATKTASTPFSRWRAGHFARPFFAVSVVLWGDVLRISGGPLWMGYALCSLGIILLLLWSPGTAPAPSVVRIIS